MRLSFDNALALSFRDQAGNGRAQFRHPCPIMRRRREYRREGGWPLGQRQFYLGDTGGEVSRSYLIAFGQDDLVTDGRLAKHVERQVICRFEPMSCIHQYVDTGEVAAPAQEGVDQRRPGRDLCLRGGGVAITWHVHHVETSATGKKNEFLRAPRRARDAREIF